MSKPPPIRVVIPAFRSIHTIRRCVDAVLLQGSPGDSEIVVVDDGDNPGLSEILSGVRVTIKRTGGSGSAAVARNLGAAGFYDGVIVFVDADVFIANGTLEKLVGPIRDGAAQAVVGNYSQNVRDLPFAAGYKQLYISLIYDRRVGYLQNDYWTAVGSIDAATFHALGGFDTSFTGACGEDGELGLRLTNRGHRILGAPDAVGHHEHALSVRALIVNDWRKGRVALLNHSNSQGRLSDNKHATPRDVLAAMLAVATVAGVLAIPLGLPFAMVPALLLVYLAARGDVMARFARQGVWFAFCALWMMLVLDLVRCTCVACSVIHTNVHAPALEESTHA